MKTRFLATIFALLAIATQAQAQTYAVTTVCDPTDGGSITINGGKTEFDEGETVKLSINAASGYTFKQVSMNGTVLQHSPNLFGGGYTASFTMPAEAVTVTAEFERTYLVTLVGGGLGSGGRYTEGASVTITALGQTGKRFKEWTGADGLSFTSGSASTATATFTMPARDVTLTATYEDITVEYPVTLVKEPSTGGGSVVAYLYWGVPKDSFAENETVNINILPHTGTSLHKLTVDGEDKTAEALAHETYNYVNEFNGYEYSFTTPARAVTVKAEFWTAAPPQITTTSLPPGTEKTAYEEKLEALNNVDFWTVVSGTLPDGLSLGNDGRITGTPVKTGTFNFSVTAQSLYGTSDPQALSITINAAPVKYDLWVGDTQVDETNKDDIPGVIGENAKASFDPATNTLTLENVTGVTGSTVGALITAEGIDLTVEGDAVLSDNTVDMGIQVAPGSLTLNGDFTISADSYGVYVQKDVTVVGGTVVAKGSAFGIYSARGDILVNGGTVEASGSMWALYPNPELSGYNPTPYVIVSENVYGSGSAAWNGTDALGGSSSTYKYVKISPLIVLLDDDSNEENKNYMRIQANLGEQVGNVNVKIEGRTLYKKGHWNTLMLPFGLSSFDGTPLEDADVRELVPDECAYSNGTLTLKFAPVTEIQPNVPYIVRWAAAEDIVNPVFENVYLEDGIRVLDLFEGGILFYGTYDPFTVEYDYRKEFLYMGGDSKLYYPKNSITINAFRAFFQLREFVAGEPSGTGNAKGIGEFVLDFGDETTSLNEELRMKSEESVGDWYSIDGRKLSGEPTAKGIYIIKGKKVVIK